MLSDVIQLRSVHLNAFLADLVRHFDGFSATTLSNKSD